MADPNVRQHARARSRSPQLRASAARASNAEAALAPMLDGLVERRRRRLWRADGRAGQRRPPIIRRIMFTDRNAAWARWIQRAAGAARHRVHRRRRRPPRRPRQRAGGARSARHPQRAGAARRESRMGTSSLSRGQEERPRSGACLPPALPYRRASPFMVIPGGVSGNFFEPAFWRHAMSEQLTLSAETRERAGKGASRVLRREGRVPAVVYGNNEEPLSIHLEEKALVKMLSTGHFMNSVVMIDAGGAPVRTLPKDVQFHPVSDRPLHVDFLRISEHAKVTVAVPIHFTDEDESRGHEARRRAQRGPPRARAGLRRGRDSGRGRDQPRRHGHRRFAAHQRGHPAQGHRIRDHRPRLHHRHHRRPVRRQDGSRGRRAPKAPQPGRGRSAARSARKAKPQPKAARNRPRSRRFQRRLGIPLRRRAPVGGAGCQPG